MNNFTPSKWGEVATKNPSIFHKISTLSTWYLKLLLHKKYQFKFTAVLGGSGQFLQQNIAQDRKPQGSN